MIEYQEANGYNNLDSALDAMLLEFRERMRQEEQDYQQEVFAQIKHKNKEPEEE